MSPLAAKHERSSTVASTAASTVTTLGLPLNPERPERSTTKKSGGHEPTPVLPEAWAISSDPTWSAGAEAQSSFGGGQKASGGNDFEPLPDIDERRCVRSRHAQQIYLRKLKQGLEKLERPRKSLEENGTSEDNMPALSMSGSSSEDTSPNRFDLSTIQQPPVQHHGATDLSTFDYIFDSLSMDDSTPTMVPREIGSTLFTFESGSENFSFTSHDDICPLPPSFLGVDKHAYPRFPDYSLMAPPEDVRSGNQRINNDKKARSIFDLLSDDLFAVPDDMAEMKSLSSRISPQSAPGDESSSSSTPASSEQSTSFDDTTDDEFWVAGDANNSQERARLLQQVPVILRLALRRFAQWMGGEALQVPSSGEASSSKDASMPSSTGKASAGSRGGGAQRNSSSKKRRAGEGVSSEADDDDDEDDDRDRPRSKKKAEPRANDEQAPLFACPFYKHDITKHHKCLSFTLRRIKDVKQHLLRRHLQPLFCIMCGQAFESQETQESHLLERSCTRPESFVRPEGITNDQKAKLTTRVSKTLSPDQQWFSVWRIVWPDASPPVSPYVQTAFVEVIEEVRKFWADNGRDIIAEQLGTAHTPYGLPAEERLLTSLLLTCGQRMTQMFTERLVVSNEDPTASQGRSDGSRTADCALASSTGAVGSQVSMPLLTLDGSDLVTEPQQHSAQMEQSWHTDEPLLPDIPGWNAATDTYEMEDTAQPEVMASEVWWPDLAGVPLTAGQGADPLFVDFADVENSLEYSDAMAAFDGMVNQAVSSHDPLPKGLITEPMIFSSRQLDNTM